MAATFDAPRRISIILVFQLLFVSLWLHENRILKCKVSAEVIDEVTNR